MDSETAGMSELDLVNFEDFIDFDQGATEDAGSSAITSQQTTFLHAEVLTGAEPALDPQLLYGEPTQSGGNFISPSQLQNDSSTPLISEYPAPVETWNTSVQHYAPALPPFQPPPTPAFSNKDSLRAYYRDAFEYYKFRANLFNDNIALSNGSPLATTDAASQQLYRELEVTFEGASSHQQPSSEQSNRGRTIRKKRRKMKMPAEINPNILKQTLTGPGIQKWAKTDPRDLNSRTRQILEFDPRKVYSERVVPLLNAGFLEYTLDAEIAPGFLFAIESLTHYLFNHPLNGSDPKDSGLRLWIQRNPADSKRRYGHDASARCRLRECCAEANLIGQAQYRVALDERHKYEDYDPLLCAGFVHLYCLEKYLNFPQICAELNVAVENRNLPKENNGRNRMQFSSLQEIQEAEQFVQTCRNGHWPAGYPSPWNHQGSLSHRLALKKIGNEPEKLRHTRKERGSKASWENHLGNLEIEAALRHESRRSNRGPNRRGPHYGDESEDFRSPSRRSRQRARPRAASEVSSLSIVDESDDGTNIADDDDEYQPNVSRSRSQSPAGKRHPFRWR